VDHSHVYSYFDYLFILKGYTRYLRDLSDPEVMVPLSCNSGGQPDLDPRLGVRNRVDVTGLVGGPERGPVGSQ
jgi:hypothetical protein